VHTQERRYDIDWLRVLATITLFLFHSARLFDYGPWHVKNGELSFGMTIFVAFVSIWIMPLFFVLSGESTCFSLKIRSGTQFAKERSRRLAVPFIFGLFVIAPPQIYLERLSTSEFAGSFFQFYPKYFEGVYGFGGNFPWWGLHLWCLLFLFIFSITALPLFLHIKRPHDAVSLSRIRAFFNKPSAIPLLGFLLASALTITELLFQPDGLLGSWSGLVYFGGWNLFVYIIFFICGYVLASTQLIEAIRKHTTSLLIIVAALSVPMLMSIVLLDVSSLVYPFGYIVFYVFTAFYSWLWVLAMLGLGSLKLSFNHRWLRAASESVLPFYILHQTVIVIIGFFIVSLDQSIIVKYILVTGLSAGATVVLMLFIRRVNLLRFLFGMSSS